VQFLTTRPALYLGQILSLLFWNLLKNIKIIDKNIISDDKYRIFKLRHPEVGIQHLRAFSHQTQQGHFHPWLF
jgi:hypothetical protein